MTNSNCPHKDEPHYAKGQQEDGMKVLNLYAGIGGNRKLWKDVEVTAVEINPKIAEIYQKFFPNDKVIVADAHQFLLKHYKEFDFIWSSPPCPSHSRMRLIQEQKEGVVHKYPDMSLYQEIIFLMNFYKRKWVVENVIPYYNSLIPAFEIGGHCFWSNFIIPDARAKPRMIIRLTDEDIVNRKSEEFELYLKSKSMRFKRDCLNNAVPPKLGLHVFRAAFIDKQKTIKSWGIGERKGTLPLGSDSRRTA